VLLLDDEEDADKVGLYKMNSVDPQRLKAPGSVDPQRLKAPGQAPGFKP
jgi:hypothetical protein